MSFNGIIYKAAKPSEGCKLPGEGAHAGRSGQLATGESCGRKNKFLEKTLETRMKSFPYEPGVVGCGKAENEYLGAQVPKVHDMGAKYIADKGSVHSCSFEVCCSENMLPERVEINDRNVLVECGSNVRPLGNHVAPGPEHLLAGFLNLDYSPEKLNCSQSSDIGSRACLGNNLTLFSCQGASVLREANTCEHQGYTDTVHHRICPLDNYNTSLPTQCPEDDLKCDGYCTINSLESTCSVCSLKFVATPVSSGRDAYRAEKDYEPTLDSRVRDIFRLEGADESLPDGSFSSSIFAALVIKYLRKSNEHLDCMELFEPFCSFPPGTLLMGYALLCRYPHGFKSASDLAGIYLACCIVSSKIRIDLHLSNTSLVRGWNIHISKINYLEAFLVNSVNYDVFVGDEEAKSAISEIRQICFEFGFFCDET